jgi:hypothetical protein
MFKEGIRQSAQDERVESLRLILERSQCRPVAYEEARELGESLISFYEVLAEEVS